MAEEFDQLELRSGSHDMEMRGFYMSNICTDDTLLEMGRLNPHGRFVHLYLNGIYWGIYHLRERWGAAMHQQYFGGSSTNYESINGNLNVGGWSDGTVYDGDGSVWKKIKSLRSDYQAIKSWLDVPQFTDYMIMWLFGGSEDEYRCVARRCLGVDLSFISTMRTVGFVSQITVRPVIALDAAHPANSRGMVRAVYFRCC